MSVAAAARPMTGMGNIENRSNEQEKKGFWKSRGEESEKRREKRETEGNAMRRMQTKLERFKMNREDMPTVRELERSLETAPSDVRLEVHQGFVQKALEDAFEDYPDDFDIEKCKRMPSDKRGGLNMRRSPFGKFRGAVEREGRRGETSVYADVIKGPDGKEYAHMWVDTGAHWDPRVNPCAVVVCELDAEGKPILNSGPNEGKAVIKVMTERDLNQAAKQNTEKEPKKDEKQIKFFRPTAKKMIFLGVWGLVLPSRVSKYKNDEQFQAAQDEYALSKLVQGKITPEAFNKLTKAEKKAKDWDEQNAKGVNRLRAGRRVEDLANRREFLGDQEKELEEAHTAEQVEVINEAEKEVKEAEEKTVINREYFEKNLREALKGGFLTENLYNSLVAMAEAQNITPEELAELRDRIAKEYEEGGADTLASISLVDTESEEENESGENENQWDALGWFEKKMTQIANADDPEKELRKIKHSARQVYKQFEDAFVELDIVGDEENGEKGYQELQRHLQELYEIERIVAERGTE